MDKVKNIILLIVSVLLIVVSALFALEVKNKPLEGIKYVDRVITLHDTIEVLKPVEIVKERKVAIHDTMWVHLTDTLVRNDTTFVPVPREYKTYANERYKAVVSGYQPRLERIDLYQTTKIVEVRDRRRWGIGLQFGYGICTDGTQFRTMPYIGFGISYDLIRW